MHNFRSVALSEVTGFIIPGTTKEISLREAAKKINTPNRSTISR